MSRHVVADSELEVVFGWDQPLETFFAQLREPGTEVAYRIIGGRLRELYDIEDLVRAVPWQARRLMTPGLEMELYRDRDEGR